MISGPFALWLAVAGPARAEDPQWLVRDWQTEDGLPESHVTAIQQTPDGYLWIGTPKGLARFGGVHFKVFPAPGGGSIRALLTSRIHP